MQSLAVKDAKLITRNDLRCCFTARRAPYGSALHRTEQRTACLQQHVSTAKQPISK